MKALVTICSKNKSAKKGLVRARERYISQRIDKVVELAQQLSVPCFILSGKFGLISSETEIPWYDHLMQEKDINDIVKKSLDFLKDFNRTNPEITQLDFYVVSPQKDPNTRVYITAIEKIAMQAGLNLKVEFCEW